MKTEAQSQKPTIPISAPVVALRWWYQKWMAQPKYTVKRIPSSASDAPSGRLCTHRRKTPRAQCSADILQRSSGTDQREKNSVMKSGKKPSNASETVRSQRGASKTRLH